jgi:hypothetical protein
MSDNTTITPRDDRETAVVGVGRRIATAIGILITAATTLLAAFGDMQWITDNLPMLGVGLGSLVSGGIASYIAVRRMRADRAAKASLVLVALGLAATGCVAIRASSDGERANVWAFGTGADSAAALSNVAVTGPSANDATGVSFDTGSSQQQSQQALQGLITLGTALAPLFQNGAAAAPAAAGTVCAPSPASSVYAADTAGFNGAPGENGEGVYGSPACPRCRAYRAAHQNAELVNVNVDANNAAMWKALRDRGFTGATVALPVAVTADGYTTNAK